MDSREPNGPQGADRTAAVSLDIGEDVAACLDDLLREFAEDAGLETVLVVDRSGALVSGVSAEEEVTVEVISALVAGASGAMRALVARIGETGEVESLHLGGNRLIYLKEVAGDFILVAVAESSRPAGLVREKARDMDSELADLLREVRPSVPPVVDSPFLEMRSLHSLRGIGGDGGVAVDFAEDEGDEGERDVEWETSSSESEDNAPFGEQEGEPLESVFEEEEEDEDEDEIEVDFPEEEEDFLETVAEGGETEEDLESVVDPDHAVEPEIEAKPVLEPRGVLEPLEFDDLEIVIEPTLALSRSPGIAVPPLDSPFEADEADVEDVEDDDPVGEDGKMPSPVEEFVDSIFELEAGEPEDDFDSEEEYDFAASLSPEPPRSLFELEDEAEDTVEPLSGNVFELADDEEWDDEFDDEFEALPVAESPPAPSPLGFPEPPVPPEPSVELVASEEADDESDENITREIDEMIAEEEEESEVRSSGPFYF